MIELVFVYNGVELVSEGLLSTGPYPSIFFGLDVGASSVVGSVINGEDPI